MTRPKQRKRGRGRPRNAADTRFAQFLDKKKITGKTAAERLEVSITYVYSLRRGAMTPGRELAIRIRDYAKEHGVSIPVDSW